MNQAGNRFSTMIERLVKTAVNGPRGNGPAPQTMADVRAELTALRGRVTDLSGGLVASRDGLLIAYDLPPGIEPTGMAALSASELSLSHRVALTAHDGDFDEVVVRSGGGYVVVYAAGPSAALTVLAGPEANVGRVHLESRPAARRIAERLATEL